MKLLLVEWDDSSTCVGWHRLSSEDDISHCISTGLLCKETEKSITLTISKSELGSIAETISIPRSCIKRIRRLRVK